MGIFDLFGKSKRAKEAEERLKAEKREAEKQRIKRIAETNLVFQDEKGRFIAERDTFMKLCNFPLSSPSFICDKLDDTKEIFEVCVWSENGTSELLKVKIKLAASETDEFADYIGTVWHFKIDYNIAPVHKIREFISSIRREIHKTISDEHTGEYYYASTICVETVADLDIHTLKYKGMKQIEVCRMDSISRKEFGDTGSAEKKGTGDRGEETLNRFKNDELKKNSATENAQSANAYAWKVRAFANLIKMGRICIGYMDRYMMDGQPMDGFTLYDAFVSVRMNLDCADADKNVPGNPILNSDIRRRIISNDINDSGAYGMYEHMYEIKREEFYILILRHLNE